MTPKKLIPIISIISVALMVIINVIVGPAAYRYSWLIVFVAGCIVAIISIIGNNKDK